MRTLPSIKLEDFEGPFDLLIELARNKKIDLFKISLAQVTDDFLEHLNEKSQNHELYADFMVVASTLLLIKIRQLMPVTLPEEEEEITDLTDRLRIYELYRKQALDLKSMWGSAKMLPAGYIETQNNVDNNSSAWPVYDGSEIYSLMKKVVSKVPSPTHPKAHLQTRGRSLQECTLIFYDRLKKKKECVFYEVVSGASKQDIAISFLAVLEMSRAQEVTLHQPSFNDSLLIKKNT